MKRTMRVSVTLKPYSNPVSELKTLLEAVPDGSTYNLSFDKADGPVGVDTYTMTITWETSS